MSRDAVSSYLDASRNKGKAGLHIPPPVSPACTGRVSRTLESQVTQLRDLDDLPLFLLLTITRAPALTPVYCPPTLPLRFLLSYTSTCARPSDGGGTLLPPTHLLHPLSYQSNVSRTLTLPYQRGVLNEVIPHAGKTQGTLQSRVLLFPV